LKATIVQTFSDRLRYAMEKLGPKVTASQLAAAVGVKPPSVSDWLSGNTKPLEGINLIRAAQKLGVNPKWLAEGKGQMHAGLRDEPSPGENLTRNIETAAARSRSQTLNRLATLMIASTPITLPDALSRAYDGGVAATRPLVEHLAKTIHELAARLVISEPSSPLVVAALTYLQHHGLEQPGNVLIAQSEDSLVTVYAAYEEGHYKHWPEDNIPDEPLHHMIDFDTNVDVLRDRVNLHYADSGVISGLRGIRFYIEPGQMNSPTLTRDNGGGWYSITSCIKLEALSRRTY
jgi:transcriptional regulator with XRE-family HTH domain